MNPDMIEALDLIVQWMASDSTTKRADLMFRLDEIVKKLKNQNPS